MLIVDKLKGNLYTRIKKHMTKKMYHLYYRENREASQSKEEYEANLLREYRHLDACRFKNKGWPCPTCPTIMAHCVHSTDEEIQMIKDQGVYIAHCPESNTDIASGIAPIRRYLDMGLHVGLGTDVAGGFSLSMFRAIADAIQVSKLRWRLMDQTQAPVTLEEAFYMATIGGGSFFGKVGSFEKGYEFDAMILDDSNIRHPQEISTRDRLERLVYLSDDRNLVGKYVQGRKVI